VRASSHKDKNAHMAFACFLIGKQGKERGSDPLFALGIG
jgi:hypothetical protein